jgi:hypothetical protein
VPTSPQPPKWIKPQLTRLVDDAPAGPGWLHESRGRISIGPYASVLAAIALRNAAIPSSLDVAMIRLIELDGDVYFYRTPLPDRQDGVNVIRFCVGSFLFFLKIDKRNSGATLPAECWLRGRTAGAFVTAPAEIFEEGRKHRLLASVPSAQQFFGEMLERSRHRAIRRRG